MSRAPVKRAPRRTAWRESCAAALACAAANVFASGTTGALPATEPLTLADDRSVEMVAGIGRYLERELAASVSHRDQHWRPDFSGRAAYEKSVAPNRGRFRRIIGAVDARVANPSLEYAGPLTVAGAVAETDRFVARAVRWPVVEGVYGEGLLLQPKAAVIARVVAIPDADQTPEMLVGTAPGLAAEHQYARRLAENGCEVIVPAIADRSDRYSGNPRVNRGVNQPHREWIYRQAYTFGRHVIGYEVQKIRSAVDWFVGSASGTGAPVGVAGWGEGGLLALYSAAVDRRIDVALVSGYFGPRDGIWEEPIYRNVFGLLTEFGDAEIARLIVPRTLVVEHANHPAVAGPPPVRDGRAGAAPGKIETPGREQVHAEVERARRLAGPFGDSIRFCETVESAGGAIGTQTLSAFLRALSVDFAALAPPGEDPRAQANPGAQERRQERLVREFEWYTQRLLQRSPGVRDEFLWQKVTASTPEAWRDAMRAYRDKYWNEVIGRLPPSSMPLNPRSRWMKDAPRWTAYDVVIDVLPDVFASGYLLLPKGIAPGERRPVVVTQHGLEGTPDSVITDDPKARGYTAYKAFAARLADRGFVVFAPQNPYRGEDRFRVLQRKANPLGKSLFAFIVAQHARILDWLATQPMVDATRIGFYGLSYGGNAAMVLPAILDDRYALSINSGCFNNWMWKAATTEWRNSYMYTREYEKPDFNLGMTFGDAEIAALIAPRPFMVERGHSDPVGLDEWIGFEYARVKRLYDRLKIPERTELEYFDGAHTIHGAGTFRFLHRHLQWPEPTP